MFLNSISLNYTNLRLLVLGLSLFHGQNVDTDAMEDVELSDLVKQVTDTSDNAAVSYTHLDVYKRQDS